MGAITTLHDEISPMFSTAIPDHAMSEALRWSTREFLRLTHWLRETITVVAAQGTTVYELVATVTDSSVVNIQAAQLGDRYLIPATKEECAQETEGYYFFEPPNFIQLAWTPDADDAAEEFNVRCILQLDRDADEIPDSVLNRWREIIVYGALSRLAKQKAMAWADPQMASDNSADYYAGIEMARLEAERQSKAYGFGHA